MSVSLSLQELKKIKDVANLITGGSATENSGIALSGNIGGNAATASAAEPGSTLYTNIEDNEVNVVYSGPHMIGEIISGDAEDRCGTSVSMNEDGTIIAIGKPNLGEHSTTYASGHVSVYKFISGEWTPLGENIYGEGSSDESGLSVSLSADGYTVAIGAPNNDGDNGTQSGHVRVYQYDEHSAADSNQTLNGNANPNFGPLGWKRLGGDIDGEAPDDLTGDNPGTVSLSADGTTIAIASIENDGNPTSGHVRVYRYDEHSAADSNQTLSNGSANPNFGPLGWKRLGLDIDGDAGNKIGSSVSLSKDGNVVAIGSTYSNHVQVYDFSNSVWNPRGSLIQGTQYMGGVGQSVSLSEDGNRVAISAKGGFETFDQTTEGQVRVYQYYSPNATWNPVGGTLYVGLNGGCDTVSLSANGNIVAVGADSSYNIDSGGGGEVRIYQLSDPNNLWEPLGPAIHADAHNEKHGDSISLSADGSTVAVGTITKGQVRIYSLSTPMRAQTAIEVLMARVTALEAKLVKR
jgi:hypothetical protein